MKAKNLKKSYQRPEVKSEKERPEKDNGRIYTPGAECGPAPGP